MQWKIFLGGDIFETWENWLGLICAYRSSTSIKLNIEDTFAVIATDSKHKYIPAGNTAVNHIVNFTTKSFTK